MWSSWCHCRPSILYVRSPSRPSSLRPKSKSATSLSPYIVSTLLISTLSTLSEKATKDCIYLFKFKNPNRWQVTTRGWRSLWKLKVAPRVNELQNQIATLEWIWCLLSCSGSYIVPITTKSSFHIETLATLINALEQY